MFGLQLTARGHAVGFLLCIVATPLLVALLHFATPRPYLVETPSQPTTVTVEDANGNPVVLTAPEGN